MALRNHLRNKGTGLKEDLRKIVQLLESPDPEVQCAAAKVLGELGPRDRDVYQALGATLKTSNHLLKVFVLEAFRKNSRKDTLPFLLPLLEDNDQIRGSVVSTLLAFGRELTPKYVDAFWRGSPAVRFTLGEIVVRLHPPDLNGFVVRVLREGSPELVNRTCEVLEEEIVRLEGRERSTLVKALITLLNKKETHREKKTLSAAIRLLGALKSPAARLPLLALVGPNQITMVRVEALHALLNLEPHAAGLTDFIRRIFPHLDDSDYPSIVLNVVNVLSRVEIPTAFLPQVLSYLDSPYADVRAFAARALATMNAEKALRGLVTALNDLDHRVREISTKALEQNPACHRLLLAEIEKQVDEERVWTLANILMVHRDRIDKKVLGRFRRRLITLLEKGDDRHRRYLGILKKLDPEGLATALYQRARQFRLARKLPQAHRVLAVLEGMPGLSPEVRFEMAILRLKTSNRGMNRVDRESDPALGAIRDLVRQTDYDPVKAFRTEKRFLAPDDYFYVGFHFAERGGEERDFGAAMLRLVVQEFGRFKVAKNARNKLKIEGLS